MDSTRIFFVFILIVSLSAANKIPIYFSYITTKTGQFIASGAIPVVDFALREINSNPDVLSNYTLMYGEILDSGCDTVKSISSFFQLFQNDSQPTYLALLGCGCSIATVPVAEISYQWNIQQFSYGAADLTLSDRNRFKSFHQVLPSFEYFPAAFLHMMMHFKWRHMAVISQPVPPFSVVTDSMKRLFKDSGIVLDYVNFNSADISMDQIFNWENEADHRIIFVNTFSAIVDRVLCEAYSRGMFYPKYVWIVLDFEFARRTNPGCPVEHINKVLNGSFIIVPKGYRIAINTSSYSGLTPSEFVSIYDQLLTEPQYQQYSKLSISGVAYDSVWAIALGLDQATRKIQMNDDSGCEGLDGEIVALENFTYKNYKLGCIMQNAFVNMTFRGITGAFEFDENGNRPNNIISLRQYRNTTAGLRTVPVFEVVNEKHPNENESVLQFATNENQYTVWGAGGVPYDGFANKVIHPIDKSLSVIFSISACFGLVFTVVCFVFNLVFRNKKLVRLTSPNLNYIIIIGAAALYISIFPTVYSFPEFGQVVEQTVFCHLQIWLFTLGYALCFGVLIAKSWRVYYIFTNPNVKKKAIKDWMLCIIVFVLVGIDLLILVIGASIPSVLIKARVVPDLQDRFTVTSDGILQRNYIFYCDNDYTLILYIVSFTYKVILQIVGIFLAFHTRRVKIKGLNDSKQIATIIYINSILLTILAVATFSLKPYHNVFSAIESLDVLIEATLFLGLLFIPTMIGLYKDPNGESVFEDISTDKTRKQSSGALGSSSLTAGQEATVDNPESQEMVDQLKIRITELEKQLSSNQFTTAELMLLHDGTPPDETNDRIPSVTFSIQ